MLGHAGINSKDQIQDCVERGWIVLAIEHRLCPGVNIYDGPMTDVRDALSWAQNGGLAQALKENGKNVDVDAERVMVMGTSSGGHLALSTAWNSTKPPLAILDFYGAKCFSDPFWTKEMPDMPKPFYDPLTEEDTNAVLAEKTVFIGGMSLEGQASDPSHPNPKQRQGFAMHQIATGKVINTIWPSYPNGLEKIDPIMNVSEDWPPVAIVHGTADTTIPMRLSKEFEALLKEKGVKTAFFEVEGEPHTFVGKMKKGSKTWDTQRKGFDWLEERLRESYN
jgi:acetyl esterase/lipase